MKFAAIAIVLGAAGATQAQVSGFSDMFRMLKRDGKLFYKQDLSAELKQLPPKVSPMPAQPDDTKVLELVHYGEISVKGSQIELSDGAEILARGFRCLADSIKGDSSTEIYTCSGNVRIIGVDETISGESVTINLKNKTFFATYGKAQIKPNLLNNQLKSDAFLSGKEASGSSKKIFGKDTSFTTCDFVVPHFHLDAQSSTIEPSKEAILRKVKIVVLGKTIVTLPILWIPLGERSFKYLPQVGQSADEGFYVKNIYGFPMRGEDRGAVRLDSSPPSASTPTWGPQEKTSAAAAREMKEVRITGTGPASSHGGHAEIEVGGYLPPRRLLRRRESSAAAPMIKAMAPMMTGSRLRSDSADPIDETTALKVWCSTASRSGLPDTFTEMPFGVIGTSTQSTSTSPQMCVINMLRPLSSMPPHFSRCGLPMVRSMLCINALQLGEPTPAGPSSASMVRAIASGVPRSFP